VALETEILRRAVIVRGHEIEADTAPGEMIERRPSRAAR